MLWNQTRSRGENLSILYDEVIAYYNWKDGEIFGIEIYNQEMAGTQRQLFEMLWKQGQPIDKSRTRAAE